MRPLSRAGGVPSSMCPHPPSTSRTLGGNWSPVPTRPRKRARLPLVPHCSLKSSHSAWDNVIAQETCNERPRLPFLSGASRTESLLAGNLFPAEHQRRANSQLCTQEAKASLLTRPDRFLQTPARPMVPFTLAGGETPRFPGAPPSSRGHRRTPSTEWDDRRRGPTSLTAKGPGSGRGTAPNCAPGPHRARPSRAGPRKLQSAGRKLRPQAGPRLAPAPPPPRATKGRGSSRGAPERSPHPQGTLGAPAGPTTRSRHLSGGPRSRGAHLLELWSPSPSCARRGRRARAARVGSSRGLARSGCRRRNSQEDGTLAIKAFSPPATWKEKGARFRKRIFIKEATHEDKGVECCGAEERWTAAAAFASWRSGSRRSFTQVRL
nr:nascent polypeptide-associated complex subunit alpha, muscle-specific form-like [Globicephala melas]